MKSRMFLIAAASVIVFAAVSVVQAQPGWGPGHGKGRGAAIWNELSKDQQQQAAALRLEFLKKKEALRSEMGQKRIEMMELASKPNVDEQSLQKKREEIWALQDKMRNERRAMGTKFRSLLTPEQRQKLGPLGPGMGMGMGHGRGAGCGFGAGLGQGRGLGMMSGAGFRADSSSL